MGRYENIESDFTVVAERLGLATNLPRVNTSIRDPSADYLKSKDVKDRLLNLYQDDFELLGYPK